MITSNKCANCGGELIFDVESQDLKCNHCSSLVNIEDKEKELEKKLLTPDSTITLSKTEYVQFLCNTCGRHHLSSSNTPLLRCPSCGDNNFTKSNKVEYTPDGIVSFKITKQTAINRLYSWLTKRPFAPNNLKKQARAGSLVGVYSPSFLYDFDCVTNYSGIGVNSYTNKDGKIRHTREHFSKSRKDNYRNYVESASSTISSNRLRSLGRFNVDKILCYSPEYLYGWIGEGVNTTLQQNSSEMQQDVAFDIKNSVRASLPYDSIENFSCNTTFSPIQYSYVYLPVYKGTYNYKEKKYNYYVNGENGKVTGSTPKSPWKIFFAVLGALAIIGGIIYLVVTNT